MRSKTTETMSLSVLVLFSINSAYFNLFGSGSIEQRELQRLPWNYTEVFQLFFH